MNVKRHHQVPLVSVCALAVVLAGCEVIAGIGDIALSGSTTDASQHPQDGSSTVGDSTTGAGEEASSAPDGTTVEAGPVGDEGDAGLLVDAASTDAEVADTSPSEGSVGPGKDSGNGTGQGGGDSGGQSSPDSGALSTELIDDMEGATGLILVSHGRSGSWFTYDDGTDGGVQTPAPADKFLPAQIAPPRGSSLYASETFGSGFTNWGAGMGFTLNDPPTGPDAGDRQTYDATAYDGFVFYARVADGTTGTFRFSVPDVDTDPAGGICPSPSSCGDHFGIVLSATSSWKQYVVRYSQLKQQNFGYAPPGGFDPGHVYGCDFQVDPDTTFDVWIDDISFIVDAPGQQGGGGGAPQQPSP